MNYTKLAAGRNILIEKERDFLRIHAVTDRTGNNTNTVDFFTANALDITPGTLVTLVYDCTPQGGKQLFQAELPPAVDPLFADGSGNIALVTAYSPRTRTGRAAVTGCVAVPVKGRQAQRRFVLPDGNGSFVYSKRGGAEIMLPAKETDGGSFCTVWLGGYSRESGLYTGAFTVDYADTEATEYIVYDSAASDLSHAAGIVCWGEMNTGSRINVPVLKRENDGLGVSMFFDPETLIASLHPYSGGVSAYNTELANSSLCQLWKSGNIKMWWML